MEEILVAHIKKPIKVKHKALVEKVWKWEKKYDGTFVKRTQKVLNKGKFNCSKPCTKLSIGYC